MEIKVKLMGNYDNSYPIYIGYDLFTDFVGKLKNSVVSKQIVLISDETVAKLYVEKFKNILEIDGYSVLAIAIKSGEKSKNNETKQWIESQMFECMINRNALIVAFGGGVVGDLAGFTASTYMRGIPYVQIPTTLLSMLDSSVGGKTAINTKYGKNLIGTFYQPVSVFMDINLLDSLPRIHLINGLVEAIKIFLTFDKLSFEYIVANIDKILVYDKEVLLYIIEKAVFHKAYIVENDEYEENLRMALNFGHTIGHAIERVSQYKVMHGFAVGVGIIIEARLAVSLGNLSEHELSVIEVLMNKLGISTKILNKYDVDEIANATLLDKKNKTVNYVKCILLRKIGEIAYVGKAVATDVSIADITKVIKGEK